jgi:hypothetical protein
MTASSMSHHLRLRLARPRADYELRRLAAGDGLIVVGPWLSEVGFEVLYWLPFLQWFAERHDVDRTRLVGVSRGGAGCWYGNLCAQTADVFDLFTPADLQAWSSERLSTRSSQKQFDPGPRDREVVRRVLEHRELDPEQVSVLYPATMYRLFAPVWDGWRAISRVRERTSNRPLPRPVERAPGTEALDEYVAVKIYFSDCFPDTDTNRTFVRRVLAALTERYDVVMLSTGLKLDDHSDLETVDAPRIHALEQYMRPANNLRVQTQAIANASAFVGTYGGFSYLAPFLGVPSVAFYSDENFIPAHLDVMRRARSDLERAGSRAGFITQHVDDLDLLGRLLHNSVTRTET